MPVCKAEAHRALELLEDYYARLDEAEEKESRRGQTWADRQKQDDAKKRRLAKEVKKGAKT